MGKLGQEKSIYSSSSRSKSLCSLFGSFFKHKLNKIFIWFIHSWCLIGAQKFGLNSPANSLTAKQVINATHRILGKAPTNRKLPSEKQHLRLLFDKFAFATLNKIQILSLISLGFTGFLRWDDLSRIKLCDIFSHESFMAIFLEQRKMTSIGKAPGFTFQNPTLNTALFFF